LGALVQQLKLEQTLTPFNRLIGSPGDAVNSDAAFVVPELMDSSESLVNSLIGFIAGVLIDRSDLTFPRNSWAWTLMREAGFVLLQKGKYTQQALAEIYDSNQTGPIGYWVAAELLSQVQPVLARKFAARGATRLSIEDFRHDYRLLFEGDTVLSQC